MIVAAKIRKIMRVEFSPTKGAYVEVLQCGHYGKLRPTRFYNFQPIRRKCGDCGAPKV